MSYQLGLPAALARRGLKVETVAGWETRSAGTFAPKGAICHWTAGPRGSTTRPSLNIVVNGRSDLAGPLCNVYLDRNGVAVVVAAGRANHAGAGNWKGLTANSELFGTECEAADQDDFTAAQRIAYPKVNAAYCDLGGFGADMVAGHSEYALPAGRKQDINGYTMANMRAQVAAILSGDDDFMALFNNVGEFQQAVNRAVLCMTPSDRTGPWLYDRVAGVDNIVTSRDPAVGNRNMGDVTKETLNQVNALRQAVAGPSAPAAAVDAAAVAAALAANTQFQDALADKVADKLAARLGNG